ncbi:MAG: hypothetical protein NXI04_24310 [Planctomycetaceae bacterium]|nr:hypothetical protein [Planctomycetaceae bacterium]
MTTSRFQLDVLHESNLQLVKAYTLKSTTQKATVETFDGWLERIDQLDGLEKEDLVRAHGELIALGFLKFEIAGSSIGLRYRVSPAGKQALERTVARAGDSEDSEGLADSQCENADENADEHVMESSDEDLAPIAQAEAA